MKIKPSNKMAQLHHRAVGNTPSTLPSAAISNCFPGLEYDFKNFWRRAFVGIVLLEWDNYVIDIEDPKYNNLKHHRLLKIDGREVLAKVSGPVIPGGDSMDLMSTTGDPGVVTMEWSNNLAYIMQRQGSPVKCEFTQMISDTPQGIPDKTTQLLQIELVVRKMFDGDTAAPSSELLLPGELTQTLCSPWQHDYRECACYYWPATRPDYVNIEATPEGTSRGDNWMSRNRTGEYILDDRKDGRLVTYEELFIKWEQMLRFEIQGKDAEES
jgi:hypothetical protein